MTRLIEHLAAALAVIVAIALPFIGIMPTATALWFFPLLIFMVVQAVGLSLILSATNLFFRDVKYLVEIFLTYAIFFTPVLYPASMLGKWETSSRRFSAAWPRAGRRGSRAPRRRWTATPRARRA